MCVFVSTAPTAAPSLETFLVTSNTTAELTWSPPPPLHQNGIIVSYTLMICDNRTSSCVNLTTADTFHNLSGIFCIIIQYVLYTYII